MANTPFRRHRQSIDHLLMAVASLDSGDNVTAAQQLKLAVAAPDFHRAMEELDDANNEAFEAQQPELESEEEVEEEEATLAALLADDESDKECDEECEEEEEQAPEVSSFRTRAGSRSERASR